MTLLLIDDNLEYGNSLVRAAKLNGINLIHFQNYEAGFEELAKNPHIQGLIFDAKCWKTKSEQAEEVQPAVDALSEGLRLLADYEQRTENYLPMVVCTGYKFPAQFFKPQLQILQAHIFEKEKTNPEQIFDLLRERISQNENYKIEREYADIFEVFANPPFEDLKKDVLAILKDVKNKKTGRKTLEAVRRIYETMRGSLPASQPKNIYPLTKIIWMGSDYLHKDSKPPSSYIVNSIVFALLEVIRWYKSK